MSHELVQELTSLQRGAQGCAPRLRARALRDAAWRCPGGRSWGAFRNEVSRRDSQHHSPRSASAPSEGAKGTQWVRDGCNAIEGATSILAY